MAFVAAAGLTLYATLPVLWANPLHLIDAVTAFSQIPVRTELFQGQMLRGDALPWHYLPTWFGLTTPPLTLLLGGIGIGRCCWRGLRHPRQLLRDGEVRFGLLLLGCLVAPVGAVIVLEAHIYNGWRHLYFLWAPFCLLAAMGLHALTAHGAAWWRRAAVYGVVGLGLAEGVGALVSLHPHQQVYFNFLGTRTPPGERYDLDYWQVAYRQGLEYLRDRDPAATLYVQHDGSPQGVVRNRAILPAADRAHIVVTDDERAAFFFYEGAPGPGIRGSPIYSLQAYGSPLLTIVARPLGVGAGRRRGPPGRPPQAVVAAGPRGAGRRLPSLHNGALSSSKEKCVPAETAGRFFLHLVAVADLPQWFRPLPR